MAACEKCGHVNSLIEAPALKVTKLPDWERHVKKETAELLKQKEVRSTIGTLENGKKFLTLYVAVEGRQSIHSTLMEAPLSTEEFCEAAYREKLAPVLDTIAENFRIVGALAQPSWLPLAMVNLNYAFGVFAFVTVEDEPFLKAKLSKLNLESLLNEGAVGTLGVYEV